MKPAIRRALLCLVLTATIPALAQTVSPAPVSQVTLSDPELLSLLRKGGLVVYFRHTATDFSKDDRQMRDHDDCASQRPLTSTGRTQARSIGAEWKRLQIPVGQVLASPYCRTRDVAQLMFGRYERSNDVRGGPVEDGADRYAGLKRLLSTLPQPPSTNLVISSHGNPYQAVIGAPYLAEGEGSVIRPLGDGRWEVLARLKADEWARLK
jgi:phosphohistidine phosphatase SixA